MAGRDTSDVLPLSTATFHIMLALADGSRHGYSIAKEVDESTNAAVQLGPGTLYRLLKQLLADGWIAEVPGDSDDDPRRRYYRLTPWGRRIAQAEAGRLADLVRVARTRKLLPLTERV